jgi:hypothetical protein
MSSPIQDVSTPVSPLVQYVNKYVFVLKTKKDRQITGIFSNSKMLVTRLLSELEAKWKVKQLTGSILDRQKYHRQNFTLNDIKDDVNIMCRQYVSNNMRNFYLYNAYSRPQYGSHISEYFDRNTEYFNTCDFTIDIVFGVDVNKPIFLSPDGTSISNTFVSDEWIHVISDEKYLSEYTTFQSLVNDKYVFLKMFINEGSTYMSLENMIEDDMDTMEDLFSDQNEDVSSNPTFDVNVEALKFLNDFYDNERKIIIMFGIDPKLPIYKFVCHNYQFRDDRLITNSEDEIVEWLTSEGHLTSDSNKTKIQEEVSICTSQIQ